MEKSKIINGEELDLLELIRSIWERKIYLLKVVFIFAVIGLIIAFTSKVEYETQCRLLPENEEGGLSSLGGLGGLAGLAGINLDMGESNGLSTQLYPEILKSTPFLTKLINTPIFFERLDTTTSSFYYFEEIDNPSLLGWIGEFTLGLPGKLVKLFKEENGEVKEYGFDRFSESDWAIIESFSERIAISIDDETGTVTISSEMPDPVAAADLTALVLKELTQKISEYRTEKSRINLEFIRSRFDESKAEYEKKQNELARFTDRNRNIANSIVQNEYERLQNELNITFEVYKSLAGQLEQAKIKLKEDTPIFTVLEPIKIPEDKSKPKRLIILLGFCFVGFLLSVVLIVANSMKRH
ncbi:Wzz/FepE/Etk N-terminal domain-containing protein [Ekhidna sp. To15]|uniref:Wzz/FepE/Etk N-terminal domain-containing protein n=1 Tax=Ekhidna sp. To15 TaxID=3395267 RepID=UPI003F51B10E